MGILDAPAYSRAASDAAFARLGSGRPGNRVVYLGDSITAASWQNSTNTQGSSFPLYAQMISGGRVLTARNAGVSGDRSDQMLARFDTDVAPYAPNAVMITAGRNDIAQAVTLATFRTNILAIVAKIRALGAVPVIGLIPPTNTGAQHVDTIKFNTWLKYYAATNGIAVVDFYNLLVDPVNGNYLAGYYSDGLHPSHAGYLAMGQLVSDKLAPLLPTWGPQLAVDNSDAAQLYGTNAVLLTDSNADGVPESWFAYGGSTGYAHALVTDSAVPGKMMQITQTANASLRAIQRSFTGFAVGDKIALAGRMTSDGGIRSQVKLTFTGNGTTANAADFTNTVTRGVFYQEFVIPASTTAVLVDLIAHPGTGIVSWGQITPMNLTALGLA
jgi:lysophospholipase L1-like esterase